MKNLFLFLLIILSLGVSIKAQNKFIVKKPIQAQGFPVSGLTGVRYIYFDPINSAVVGDENFPAEEIHSRYYQGDSLLLTGDAEVSGDGNFVGDLSSANITVEDSVISNFVKTNTYYSILDSGSTLFSIDNGLVNSVIDLNKLLIHNWYAGTFNNIRIYNGTNKVYESGLTAVYNAIKRKSNLYLYIFTGVRFEDSSAEMYRILSSSNDTIYVDGIWSHPDGLYNSNKNHYLNTILQEPTQDTTYYKRSNLAYDKISTIPVQTKKMISNNSSNVVSKTGGVMFRHDNWMGFPDMYLALMEYVSTLDKYNLKATLALNEWHEGDANAWTENYKRFWKMMQVNGHDIADHGMNHSNYNYAVQDQFLNVSEETPGVASITQTTLSGVPVNVVTMERSAGSFTTGAGLDLMFKRAKDMFQWLGLNEPTYWIEGGGQNTYYPPDTLDIVSRLNGFVGGGKYRYYNNYKHSGFNPPLNWIGKSEYCMDWQDITAITPVKDQSGSGGRKYDAKTAITQIADQSARHTLTIVGTHFNLMDQWVLDWYDSVASFISQNPYFVKQMTGSDWARTMFQSPTNPYENIIPSFEFDIDGDLIPDGWDFWITRFSAKGGTSEGNVASYPIKNYSTLDRWVTGGSQGSKYSVAVTSSDTLYCHNLYGVEKGTNKFKIDVKELDSGSDSVHVKIVYYYGDLAGSLSNSTVIFSYPVTSSWVTKESYIDFPYNTSFIRMFIYGDNSNASLVDELYLGLKQ